MADGRDIAAVLDRHAGRASALRALDAALRGQFDPPYLPMRNRSQMAREYNDLIKRAETPILGMLIDAQVDRLRVIGVQVDQSADRPDNEVWGWWQSSSMDRSQTLLYRDSAAYGDGFLLVTLLDDDTPRFSVESPLALAVEYDEEDPLLVRRAVKLVGESTAVLYDAEAITRFKRSVGSPSGWVVESRWEHAAGQCPVVRFPNSIDSLGRSSSEIAPVLPIQARVNQGLFDRLLLQRSQSWKQRWATGMDIEVDAEGKPIAPFETGADTLLVNQSPDGRFGEFGQADLDPLIRSIDADVAAAAMITRTPPHFLPQATISSVSAEALVALEAAFSAKIAEKQGVLGEAHERALRIGGRMVGYDVPDSAEVIWSDLELRSLAQKADAATKLRSIGVPMRQVLELLGWSDQKIERVLAEQEREQVQAAQAQATAFGIGGGGAAG